MPAKLISPSPRYSSYAASGLTLKTKWDKIMKVGPVDPNDGKHVAFLTTTEIVFDPDKATFAGVGKIKLDKRSGWFDAKTRINKMDVIMMSYIDGPKRPASGLSKPATKEWLRFYDKAWAHEVEHIKKAVKESEAIVKEINALRGSGLGETEKEAAEAAIDDLKTKIFDKYTGKMDARLNKIHAKFDKSTKHGETKGAKLDTSVV